jgi:hypothetical protein
MAVDGGRARRWWSWERDHTPRASGKQDDVVLRDRSIALAAEGLPAGGLQATFYRFVGGFERMGELGRQVGVSTLGLFVRGLAHRVKD